VIVDLSINFLAVDVSFYDMAREISGVELANVLHSTQERRLQTLSVCLFLFLYICFGLICAILVIWLLFTPFYVIPLVYAAWYVYDLRTPERGGRRCEWIRNMKVWRYVRDYFPMTLRSTCPLDPDKNYLMIYHPHGIITTGVILNFGTNAADFHEHFPGIRCTGTSLNFQFMLPLYREYVLALGFCSCSKQSIEHLLTSNGLGNAVVLTVGGASEALDAHPGSFTLTLKHRKGFVRIAMRHGIPLVPMFGFGENDLYNQVANPPGSRLRTFQTFMMKWLTFSTPVIHGRGIVGILPFRRPVNVVVGGPLEVAKVLSPTEDQVDQVHQQYVARLVSLFETYKSDYGVSPQQHLNIV